MEPQAQPLSALTGLILILILVGFFRIAFKRLFRRGTNREKAATVLAERGQSEVVSVTLSKGPSKYVILPGKQFSLMVAIGVASGFALSFWGRGDDVARALGGGIGMSIATIGMAGLVALVPAGPYLLIKRKRMPGLSAVFWVVWAGWHGFMLIYILGLLVLSG